MIHPHPPADGWTDPNSEQPPLGLSLMIIHLLHNQTLRLSWANVRAHTHTLIRMRAHTHFEVTAPSHPPPPCPRAAALSSSWAPRAAHWSASLLCHLTHWTSDNTLGATGRLPQAHVLADGNRIRQRSLEVRTPFTCPHFLKTVAKSTGSVNIFKVRGHHEDRTDGDCALFPPQHHKHLFLK